MLRYQLFPRSIGMTGHLDQVIRCFELAYDDIKSPEKLLNSNGVLAHLRPHLEQIDYKIESGKTKSEKIPVPVLFGLNNRVDKAFSADGLSADGKIVLEVEAGRAFVNFGFLKHVVQASLMHNVEYLVLAVRNDYKKHDDFMSIRTFLETLYISNRLVIPLKGILLIGY
jgi:hypothetical protein